MGSDEHEHEHEHELVGDDGATHRERRRSQTMGFNWVAAGFVGVVVAVLTLVVHGSTIAVRRYTAEDSREHLPYVAIALGGVLLSLQLLPLPGLVEQVSKPTPVYVGHSVVVFSVGLLAVGTRRLGENWRGPVVVLWPVVALVPVYLLAPLISGLPWMPSFVPLQWQDVSELTVIATLLLLVGSFAVAGYYGRAALRATPGALIPPVIAVYTRIATQATIGTGFDGLSVTVYIILAPVLVLVGLLLYLVGFGVKPPGSDRTGTG